MALDKISNEVGISWFRCRSNHCKCNKKTSLQFEDVFILFTDKKQAKVNTFFSPLLISQYPNTGIQTITAKNYSHCNEI